MSDLYVTKIHLSKAADAALLADSCMWSGIDGTEYRIKRLRQALVMAMSGCEAGTGQDECRETLLDVIETAISDSFDIDWTAADGARSVLDAILDNIAPLPADKKADAA